MCMCVCVYAYLCICCVPLATNLTYQRTNLMNVEVPISFSIAFRQRFFRCIFSAAWLSTTCHPRTLVHLRLPKHWKVHLPLYTLNPWFSNSKVLKFVQNGINSGTLHSIHMFLICIVTVMGCSDSWVWKLKKAKPTKKQLRWVGGFRPLSIWKLPKLACIWNYMI